MKILLAADGSEHSQSAVDLLSTFPFGAPPEILVISVSPAASLEGPLEDIPDFYKEYAEECQAAGLAILHQAEESCRPWCSIVKTRLLSGSPARVIVEEAKKNQMDLIVLGARGQGAISRFLLGSVSDSVSKQAECSVLVVRPRPQSEDQSELRILIATDDTVPASRAVSRFAEFPLGEGTHVKLISVVNVLQAYHQEHTLNRGPALTTLLAENQDRLQASAAHLKKATPHVDTRLIEINRGMGAKESNVAEQILREADHWKPHLIVMGNTGRSGWGRVLLGSVSTKVLQHALCSVWIERGDPTVVSS